MRCRNRRTFDLFWPRANISVEYDSDKHHRGDRKASEDAIRRNGIEHLAHES